MPYRDPLPPPFQRGSIIESIRDPRGGVLASDGQLLYRRGRRAVVTECRFGHRGTGALLGHDEEGPYFDETVDGHNVIEFDVSLGTIHGADGEKPIKTRALFPDGADGWIVVGKVE